MSGMYGTVKPADINIEDDVEIFYNYRASLSEENNMNFNRLANNLLVECGETNGTVSISGLFNLKLPLNIFNKKGVYTIYIKPKEITVNISDIGVLAAFPDVRGVIFNSDGNMAPFKTNNSLVGYRIDYMNNNKKNGNFNIITSSNLSEAIAYNLNNSFEKSTKYRFTDSGNSIFCTVTPSLSTNFKPNYLPYIGTSGETIKLVNTKFNPIMIEIEMVEHDEETLTYMLEGNQLIDKDKGLITIFNKDGEIYHQSEYGAYKDEYGNPLFEFKKEKDNIDFTQKLDNLE